MLFRICAVLCNFYPRPPRGGRRGVCAGIVAPELISIHALREEGDRAVRGKSHPASPISIHALREEGDLVRLSCPLYALLFLSTPSARRATRTFLVFCAVFCYFYPRPPRGGRLAAQAVGIRNFYISIHALREEGDRGCGRRRACQSRFLSTPSARRATPGSGRVALRSKRISIHALREEGDSKNRDKISIFKQIIQHSARI